MYNQHEFYLVLAISSLRSDFRSVLHPPANCPSMAAHSWEKELSWESGKQRWHKKPRLCASCKCKERGSEGQARGLSCCGCCTSSTARFGSACLYLNQQLDKRNGFFPPACLHPHLILSNPSFPDLGAGAHSPGCRKSPCTVQEGRGSLLSWLKRPGSR